MDICILCKSSKKDDIQYGDFLKNKKFGVHTFCLYLSSNLAQNGNDDEGFLGFLEKDIQMEVKRISLLKCCYCNEKYANIGCCEKRCHRTFHLICGINNKAENKFCNDYRSYCHRHARKVKERPSSTETCLICFESLCGPDEKFNRIAMILTPCCRNGWFHKLCLQKFAKTAGYFFKCPLCNDDKIFREKLPSRGIFIPNQDAAWELEPNAFAELLERPNKCAAKQCKNRKGRKAQTDTNPFIMCQACGSIAIHKLCLPNDKQFNCDDCSIAKDDHDSGRESLNSHANRNEDEFIDVCHVSDKEDLEIINRLIATSSKMTENKRDSGTKMDTDSSDEETPKTSTNCRRFAQSIKTLNSDTESGNDIKPSAVKRIGHKRLESESSSVSQELITDKGKGSNAEIQQRNNLINESNAGNAVCTDSDSDDHTTQQENSKLTEFETINNNEVETEEEAIRSYTKRKTLIIHSDSEDELFSAEQKRFKSINNEREIPHNHSCTLTDEDSNDPLENFSELILKRAKKRFTHLGRTIRGREYGKSDTANRSNQARYKTNDKNKNTKLVKLQGSNEKPQNNLDISCIAKRTRRKTICSGRSNQVSAAKQNAENESPFNISCIALRTRRKTICGQTDFSKISTFEMSRIYEKVHQSTESLATLSEDEDSENYDEDESTEKESTTYTSSKDSDSFIVEDSYDEKDSKFEISCIANRTRKRKSVTQQRLPRIMEVTDSDSENSIPSAKVYNSNKLRRQNYRLDSNSSEDFEPTPFSRQTRKTACSNQEKFPVQDFTPVLKTYNKSYNYHPSHSYHPHSSNRNRF